MFDGAVFVMTQLSFYSFAVLRGAQRRILHNDADGARAARHRCYHLLSPPGFTRSWLHCLPPRLSGREPRRTRMALWTSLYRL